MANARARRALHYNDRLIVSGGGVSLTLAERITAAGVGTLLRHWEVGPDYVTLNGSNVSQLDDRVGTGHAVQATAGNQPAYNATGGPNGRPAIIPQGTTRYLQTGSLGHAAGKNLGVYYVMALPGTSAATIQAATVYTAGSTISAGLYEYASGWRAVIRTNGGGLQANDLTTPTPTSAWGRHAFELLASGAVGRYQNTSFVPQFTGTPTSDTVESMLVGSPTQSGGKFAFLCVVDGVVAGTRAVVDTYLNEVYNLGLT